MALVALMVPSLGPPAAANGDPVEYWVDPVDGDNGNPGTEAEPFKTITHAIDVASGLDTIMLLPGTYNAASGETFPLLPGGESFKGVGGADVTIIEGPGTGGSNTMIMNNPWIDDFVEGITFTNGGTGTGGALLVSINNGMTAPDSPRISDCVFSDNTAAGSGGGALCIVGAAPLSHPLVENCLFIRNESSTNGGALKLDGSVSATLRGNAFIDNAAESGGALIVTTTDAPLVCEDNYFDGNDAVYGGAVYISLAGSEEQLFTGNAFYSNEASDQGGAFWLYGATVTMTGNDAGGNSSEGDAGFTYMWHTVVEAENNVIGGSHASDTGGVWYMNEATLFENNDTVAGSTGSEHVVFPATAYAEFTNCIYWNPECEDEFINAHLIAYCCVSDPDVFNGKNNTDGGGNIVGDDPMMIGGEAHDPRLMYDSPCVDAADPTTAAALDFYGDARPVDGDGDGTALPDMGACERPLAELTPYSGEDRYDTAAMIALANFETADLAIIASGANFPDALSAAGLAGAFGAPLVLTRPDLVPLASADALEDLGVSDVIIIGGPSAVGVAVETALEADYAVERIAGLDRYETAALVAERIVEERGDQFSHAAFIARGDAFPDALSVSPGAYSDASPILLTRPDVLPTATAEAIDDLDIEDAVVVGGLAAVSDTVKTQIDGMLLANGGHASDRWFGPDRYATAVAVAENAVDWGFASFGYVGVATGENYPDALAGGVGAGVQGGVVALTASSALSPATKTMLETHGAKVLYLEVFGGTSAVSTIVRTAIEDALGW